MRGLAIRWRLTLWYAAILAVILILFSAAVYYLMGEHLLSRMDSTLRAELNAIDEELEESSTTTRLSARLHRRFGHYEHVFFDVRYRDSNVPLFSRHLGTAPFPARQAVTENTGDVSTYQSPDGNRWRIASTVIPGPSGPMVARVAASLAGDEHERRELLGTLLLIGPLALIGAFAGGYVLARRALAPVDRMTREAQAITAHRLDRRLEVSSPHDELGRLASTLNDMIARLQNSFAHMQRFTADAAHELRTPVTIIRSEAEVALRTTRTVEEYRHSLETLLEEVSHLTHLADQLLYLCREDAGTSQMMRETVALDQLVSEVSGHMRALADEKGINLIWNKHETCRMQGDPERLRRVLFNLLSNAIKFTPAGGTVSVSLDCPNGQLELVVADTGPGIPAEQLPRVFDRFHRINAARESGGTGLGLAISRAIVESHHGSIMIDSDVGEGTRVTVTLPINGA